MDPTEWMDVSQYMRPRDDAPAPASAPEPEGLAALVAMGFGRAAAEATLAAHGGDVGAAANALSATAHAATATRLGETRSAIAYDGSACACLSAA